MLGNKKPKGDKPQAPPPPPMKPQKIEVEYCSPTIEEIARVFCVPPHLLAQSEPGSLQQRAFEEFEQAFVRKMAQHLNELAAYYKNRMK